jgi:hypothetical protein
MKESWQAIAIAIAVGALALYLLFNFVGFVLDHPGWFATIGVAAVAVGSYFISKKN